MHLKLSKIHHFRFGMVWNVPFSSNSESSFWRENSNVVKITMKSLTFELNLPLNHERSEWVLVWPFDRYSSTFLLLVDLCILEENEHFFREINHFVPSTVWKFYEVSITQNLREIYFWDFTSAKFAILAHLGALNF